jgi:predicted metal-dependent peptidase
MNANEKMVKARTGMVLNQPFFASLALRLRLKEDESCETLWTDGHTLGFNPKFVDGLPLDQVKGIIAHEVMHLACAHHTRRGERDQKKWNVAGDYAINQILEDSKIELPEGHLIDPAFIGMASEQIYGRIPDPPPRTSPGSGDPNGGQGPDQNHGQGQEPGNQDPGKCGEVRDAKGPQGQDLSPAEKTQEEQNWKIATAQAATQAKAMGDLPGGIARMVGEIMAPHVDWREVLRRFVDQSARNDYTWTRPNRRYLHAGLYLPALYSETLPPIVIAVDTSGSIDSEMLDRFASEMTAILQEHKTSCNVLYCDTEIAGVESFTSEDLPLKLNPQGGGGTDFRPPFAWVDKQGITPACLIYLTDMFCHRFPDPPDYPVLWAKTEDYGEAPFGEEVRIS